MNNSKFVKLSNDELMEVDGGFLVEAAAVCAIITFCYGAGYAVGTHSKNMKNKGK